MELLIEFLQINADELLDRFEDKLLIKHGEYADGDNWGQL
jgi:hypothetical protein